MVTTKHYIKILASVTCILLICGLLISCNYLGPTVDEQPSPTETDNSNNNNDSIRPILSSSLDYGLLNVADTVEKVRPSVVSIVSETVVRNRYGRPRPAFGSGTGVIFTAAGLVLTNNHVIEKSNSITVTMEDGTQEKAKLIGSDPMSDLAVLKLPSGPYPYLPLAINSKPRVGDWVIAIGNALALPGGPTVTVGVISALGRSLEVANGVTLFDLIQTDTVINPGSSGGPLLNLSGELVGINTAVQRFSDTGTLVEGVGFAINVQTATLISQQLVDLGRVRWAWIGAFLDDLDPRRAAEAGLPIREGVVVLNLFKDGPAHKYGVKRGDIILSLDDHKVGTTQTLAKHMRQTFAPGDEIQVELYRNGERITIPIILEERPKV